MSRYTLTPKQPGVTIDCGYDGPLQTFFAIVMRNPEQDDEDNVILWIGGRQREILRAEDLVDRVKPYADLDADMLARLRCDLAEAKAPTSLQRRGAGFGGGR